MAHVGLLCTNGSGQYNSVVPLGQELKHRGHQITLCSFPDAEPVAAAAGFEFMSCLNPDSNLGSATKAGQTLGELSGIEYLRASCRLAIPLFQQRLQATPLALKTAGIEFLIINSMVLEGSSIAEAQGIPFVTTFSSLLPIWDLRVPPFTTHWSYSRLPWAILRNGWGYRQLDQALRPFLDLIAAYRQAQHLPAITHPNQYFSTLAQISQQPPAFEYPDRDLPPCLHFTGPHHSSSSRPPIDFPWDRLTDQPIMYASMGTNTNRHLEVYTMIASACADLDVQLVISLGGAADPDALPTLAGDPLVVKYAPQLELLDRTRLMITHGGMNSTLECLARAIPMIVIPIALDQPGIAARVAWAGVGEFVPLNHVSPIRLKGLINQILTQPSYHANAERLQQSIQQSGGVSEAIDIVEQVLKTGKPVLRSEWNGGLRERIPSSS